MRFALLGTDAESVALAEAALASSHEIAWCGDVTAWQTIQEHEISSHSWLERQDRAESWEELLDHRAVDAVIVGRGAAPTELRAEQLNQLVKNEIPTLTTFPLFDSVLKYYEIDMSRVESGSILQHYNPLVVNSSLLREGAGWICNGHPQLGAIEQFVWERPLAERSRENVLWHFSRDVELLGHVAGRLNRLGALGSPEEAATYRGLSVQLLGESKTPVRWEVGPVEKSAWPRLQFIGQEGKLTWEFNEFGQAMQTEITRAGQSQTSPLEETSCPTQAVDRFVKALEVGNPAASTWPTALHAMELTDTIEISLRRGRMIEVHNQQLTEQLAFKGTMSAVGCGVLLVLPPLLLLCGWLAEKMGLPVADYWEHALLALLAVFLLLQFLPRLLLKPNNPEPQTDSDSH